MMFSDTEKVTESTTITPSPLFHERSFRSHDWPLDLAKAGSRAKLFHERSFRSHDWPLDLAKAGPRAKLHEKNLAERHS
jgi:hypothetical protein